MTATATDEIRERRERLGVTRLALAVAADVSTTHLAEIEGGRWPHGAALTPIEQALDRLEAQAAYAFVPFAEVRKHLQTGTPATDGPKAAA